MTFGCQMNVNDSLWLSRALQARGFSETQQQEDAKIFIINTCSVREKPEQKVYSLLGRLKRYYKKDSRVFAAVGGCVAQQVGREFFSRFPFVRLVFGADGAPMAPQAIERLAQEPGLRISLLDFTEDLAERPLHAEQPQEHGGRAFVSIMQGCDNYCAYCIVPYVRGRQKSRSSAAIINECKTLVSNGVREITLLGQNVNAYGQDKHGDGVPFSTLVREIASIDGLLRLRFTTSHPKDLEDDIIRAYGELDALCPSLHLPLQSGSDKILKGMGRKYDMARYLDIVSKLRESCPQMVLSTDWIVGFPGETEEDFSATLHALRKIEFETSFCFKYSDRPGVRAEKMAPKIEESVKDERLARLLEVQKELTRSAYEAQVGKQAQVLLEGVSQTPPKALMEGVVSPVLWRGRDAFGRVVNLEVPERFHSDESEDKQTAAIAGKMIDAVITEAKKHSLFGKTAGEPW